MTAETKTLRLDQILVPADRLRKVDDRAAHVIGASIAAGGQHQPIVVRPTPAAARPYTLVDGETRYRGSELNGLVEIEAVVRKLNPAQARLVEIEANLIRDELDKLERALAIAEYRRLWEEEHGEIRRGHNNLPNSRNLRELEDDVGKQGFAAEVLDKFGLSKDAVRRACTIAGMQRPLVEALFNAPVADNQSLLLKLAALDPARQLMVAKAFAREPDIERALYLTDPNAKAKAQQTSGQKRHSTVISNFHALGRPERRTTLQELFQKYPDEVAWALANPLPAAGGGGIMSPDPRQVTIFDLLGGEQP